MKELNSVNREGFGLVISQEQLEHIPGLRNACSDIVCDQGLLLSADSGPEPLEEIWEVVCRWKGGGIQSQVAGYAPGSLNELLCLRDCNYKPLLIASRRVVCDIINRTRPLSGTLIENGCYWINVEDGIMYLVLHESDDVSMMDEAYFGGELLTEMAEQGADSPVTVEELSTGKSYSETMQDALAKTSEPFLVSTENETYVVTDCTASIASFSTWAWGEFCEGYNPRT